MSRAFTHYWNRESWEIGREGDFDLGWLASSQWVVAGVEAGDRLYPVTLRDGVVYLGGRMTVSQVVPRDAAIRILKTDDIWEAPFVAIAANGGNTSMMFDRTVPLDVVRRLRF